MFLDQTLFDSDSNTCAYKALIHNQSLPVLFPIWNLRISSRFGRMRRTVNGFRTTQFFLPLGIAAAGETYIFELLHCSSQEPIFWALYKDPSTDLRYVIPIRLYGDGADAQSSLVKYLCFKMVVSHVKM